MPRHIQDEIWGACLWTNAGRSFSDIPQIIPRCYTLLRLSAIFSRSGTHPRPVGSAKGAGNPNRSGKTATELAAVSGARLSTVAGLGTTVVRIQLYRAPKGRYYSMLHRKGMPGWLLNRGFAHGLTLMSQRPLLKASLAPHDSTIDVSDRFQDISSRKRTSTQTTRCNEEHTGKQISNELH